MTSLTLTGVLAVDRRPAAPAPLDMDHVLDLAETAKRRPGSLNATELWQLGEGVEVLESNLLGEGVKLMQERARADQLEQERDDAIEACAVLRAALQALRRNQQPQRYTATYERLTVSFDLACHTIAGASYAEVAARLNASVPSTLPVFDLSDEMPSAFGPSEDS